MTSETSLSARLSSQAIVNPTEAHDAPSPLQMSVTSDVESQAFSESPASESPASQTPNVIHSRRIWDGIAGRAWYEAAIVVRNTHGLHTLPWTHHHWKEIAERLRLRGIDRPWKACRSQYGNMRLRWNDRCHLLDQSGFGIDEEGKISVGNPVWNRFVAVSTIINIFVCQVIY